MVTKKFGIDFNSIGGALTLPIESVSDIGHIENAVQSKTHESGWTIKGRLETGYYNYVWLNQFEAYHYNYVWLNQFEAYHPVFGKVWGDFEDEVFADSEEGFAHFFENHPPNDWSYCEI